MLFATTDVSNASRVACADSAADDGAAVVGVVVILGGVVCFRGSVVIVLVFVIAVAVVGLALAIASVSQLREIYGKKKERF